ncbi:ankyrin repeat, PH and SEC7 domain containing protein secG-like isoform X2 [Halichondria panicea]|uniref:ankyrin repeat, PH and SEC7 domain containing protein secG-like isoform X2 n=1 Tax=Halichondria panicea TaxID=6063 RepID=UPI00312B8BEF
MATGQDSGIRAQEQLAVDLWEAARVNDVIKVRSLLGQGANPNHQLYWSKDWYQFSKKNRRPPVNQACYQGYLEITRALVSGGADIEKGDEQWGMNALHYACWGGHMETVVYLSQVVKCHVDARDEGYQTPLHLACRGGSILIVKYLVEECKVDVDVKDENNRTPLHFACLSGNIKVVKYLVEECRCDVDVTEDDGETPLDTAIDRDYTEVVNYLKSVQKPSTLEPVNVQNRTYLKKLDELIADTNNTIELRYLKTHFIGPSDLGKTTTRQRLVGSITNLSLLPKDQRKRCSTLLAECEQVLAFVDKSGTKLEFKASSNLEEETQFIFSYLMSCEPIEDSTVGNTSPLKKQPTKETTDQNNQTQLKIDEAATAPQKMGPTPEPEKTTTVDVGKVVSRLQH